MFFIRMYKLLKIKLKEFSEKVKPLCSTLNETITMLSRATIDVNETFISIKKLELVKSKIISLKSSISTKKDILFNFYKYYVEDMVPSNKPDDQVSKYCSTVHPNIKQANKDLLNILQGKYYRDLESLKSLISQYTEKIKEFEIKLKEACEFIDKKVMELECAIEGVARNLIRCSIQSLSKQLINLETAYNNRLINDIGVVDIDNQVVSIYSVMSVMDYKVVINRLFKMLNKSDDIYNVLNRVEYCQCLTFYNHENKNVFRLSDRFKFSHEYSHSKFHTDGVKSNEGNHICLCIVTNYVLYPSMVKAMCYLMDCDLDTLSTLSRKFEKYRVSKSAKTELGRLCILSIQVIDMIGRMMNEKLLCSCKDLMCKCVMRNKYRSRSSIVSNHGSNDSTRDNDTISYELYKWFTFFANMAYNITSPIHQGIIPNIFKCYCLYHNNRWYSYFVTIVLVLSSLIENIWTMDTESITMAIECVSILMSEFHMIDSQTNNRLFITMNLFKLSFVSGLSSSTQSCKMLAKLRIIIDLVSLSTKVRVLESVIKTYIKNLSLCNIFHFDKILNQLKGYDKTKDYIGWVLKKYESVGSECKGCNKSNCCCNICVNLMALWVSIYIWLKVNIKLNESNKRYKERLEILLKRICNHDNDCCCTELQTVCQDLCCGKGCQDQCVCKQLKESCAKICGDTSNCLCKQVSDVISKCCVGSKECKCKDKEGCCRCACSKIVAQSVRLLRRACRANVLEPYKRVVVGLLSCDKNKEDVIRTIVEGINKTTLNNIYLVKNSYSSYPYSVGSYKATINGVTNVETRNWGYDTKYEHDVSNDRGFRRGDWYPNILSDPRYTFSHLSLFLNNYRYMCMISTCNP